MKKLCLIVLTLLLVMSVAVGLFACKKESSGTNGDNTVIQDPALRKVSQAFAGVESSMRRASSLRAEKSTEGVLGATVTKEHILALGAADGDVAVGGKAGGMTESEALQLIRDLYTAGDRQSSWSSELDYDEPPMQQFRYLKAIFDTMGADYELGTKYYYDITGTVDFDPTTGFPKKGNAEYRYQYVFGFAMSVELKEDDLIFAEVAFKISLSKGEENLETNWYVSFDLDYDFDENEPTYTLTMYTDNREADLTFLHRPQGYEYDYVEVDKGAIKEWRKFVMDTDRAITMDAAHSSFSDYIEEGITFGTDTAKWLKDGAFYKITAMTDEKSATLARAFADGLGMNSTAIGSAAFYNKAGKQNPIIDTFYKQISNTYGEDIIYDLVCDNDDDHGGNGGDGGNTGSSWGAIVGRISGFIPDFESSTATFEILQRIDPVVYISVQNASETDYDRFREALENAGFSPDAESGNTYFRIEGDVTIAIGLFADSDRISIGLFTYGEDTQPIWIYRGYDYTDANYEGYEMVTFQKAADLYDVIEGISFGSVTPDELSGLSARDSALYDITLSYEKDSGMTAEECAASAVKAYSGKYIDGAWTNREGNMLHYNTVEGKEVLILLSTKVSEGSPHVLIYVLQFEEGNIPEILESNGSGSGGNGGENGGDAGGNGGSGEIGGEGGDGGDPQIAEITVQVLLYDKKGNVESYEYKKYAKDEVVSPSDFEASEKYTIYLDKGFKEPFLSPIKVRDGLELYALKNSSEGGGNEGGGNGGSGDGGNGGSGEIGGNEGGNGGNGEIGGEDIRIRIVLLNSDKSFNKEDYVTVKDGQSLLVANFLTEAGQGAYTDMSCSFPFGETIEAYSGLAIYLWKDTPKGTFTIYDVTDEGTNEQPESFEAYIGSGVYFGYSFEYILYWDEACTQAIPLDYDFDLTEEGITVYRHIYDDFFVLNVKTYVNGHYHDTTSSVHKKEKIYPAFESFGRGLIEDYYESDFLAYGDDATIAYYLGENKESRLTGASMIATSEDDLTVCIYINNPAIHIYTIKVGDTVLTTDYCLDYDQFDAFYYAEGQNNSFDYMNRRAAYCTFDEKENVITMHDVTILKGPLTIYWTLDGRVLFERTDYVSTYFTADDPFRFCGDVGASTEFFRDVRCTDPIILEADQYGDGVYEVKSALTLYSPWTSPIN